MKTKLLLAAAISALSLGATGAMAAPAPAVTDIATAVTDIATQGDAAVEQAKHKFYYGYYYYPYYYYKPYYYYPYYCPYWKKLKGWC
jgi:hypothetical protein